MSAGAPPPPPNGRVTVVLTVLRDPRVARTLESLLAQERPPEEILVDDGGGTDQVQRITEGFTRRDPRVKHLLAPGTIAESRNRALEVATGDLVVFLDADEIAPVGWLGKLLAPFADPTVGFTGGPTPALPESLHHVAARFYDGYLRRFYDTVARERPHALPMGNSAWRMAALREAGPLDPMGHRRIGNEDQDIAVRILARGWKGVYVPEAWVGHDFSDISLRALLRKQRAYAEGGYLIWRKHGTTYEASAARLAPYILGPLLLAVGALLLLPPLTREVGAFVVAAGLLELVVLAVLLTAKGVAQDRRYPGLRWNALEILRRWATLYGAFRGWLSSR
jgi:cellulose synthase/poly-beta-1,6-N-acetylglucosamine synthase-like glycosyltransferase